MLDVDVDVHVDTFGTSNKMREYNCVTLCAVCSVTIRTYGSVDIEDSILPDTCTWWTGYSSSSV